MQPKPLPATADLAALQGKGSRAASTTPEPGVLVVFASGKPAHAVLSLESGRLEVGRGLLVEAGVDDAGMSRRHAAIFFDGKRWTIRDLESRNGTFVDGERVTERVCEHEPVVRFGSAIAILAPDVRAFREANPAATDANAIVIGAKLAAANAEIDRVANFGHTLFVRGESGAGKEIAARRFHDAGPHKSGPFVAVNCATIPEGVAERVLFGAVRGAYSGADANTEGYVQAANGGTLFLDEIAELDLAVQAKLLRVIETRQVAALGSSKLRDVDIGIVSATHRDLRASVADGRFREDLYFRIGRPEVRVPPLRERREEILFHAQRAIRAATAPSAKVLAMEPAFAESLLTRHWPGNVRELIAEVSLAAQRAIAARREEIVAGDLAEDAGRAIVSANDEKSATPVVASSKSDAEIEAALREHEGNVSAAARALNMHRNQVRRWLERKDGRE